MRSNCAIAVAGLILATAFLPRQVAGGQVADKGDPFWWVTGVALGAPNNDDFVGVFANNPNKVNVNSVSPGGDRTRQSVDAIERIVPTAASAGTTEYALTLGGNSPPTAPGQVFPEALNNPYIIELGFGTGSNFVPARNVAALLRFDSPDNVSPPIQNYKPISIATLPALELTQDLGDALLIQGRYDLGNFRISSFGSSSLFVLPLDIPDLPLSARSYYSPAELAGLSDSEVPFTIRMHILPEPGTFGLAILGLAALVAHPHRKRSASRARRDQLEPMRA